MDKPVPRRTWDAQYAGRGYESAVVWGDTGEQDYQEHIFFFQAEDGIRDIGVTGVQTCALPILLHRAATEMKQRLNGMSPATFLRTHGPLVITTEYVRPPGLEWNDDRYIGDAYGTYSWGCNVVEVEVDRTTWEVNPLKVTAVVEIGKAIHPGMVTGQVEGGTAQGIGYALLEEVVMRQGRMEN